MGRTSGSPAGAVLARTLARRGSAWHGAGMVAALAAAVALWVGVLAAVAAPPGGALARREARPTPPPACATPPEAVASAAAVRPATACR